MRKYLKKFGTLAVALLSLLFINASISTQYVSPLNPLPPAPAIGRNISLVQLSNIQGTNQEAYQYPYAPPFRTSADGRVALNVKEIHGGYLQFYLFVPEAVNNGGTPFRLTSVPTPTPVIMPVTTPYGGTNGWADSNLSIPAPATQQHHTICDGTVQTYPAPATQNPYTSVSRPGSSCATNSDCYDLWVITPADYTDSSGFHLTLYGTEITVTVANPKTPSATISSIVPVATAPVKVGPTFNGPNHLLEPMVTADGHLLVGRIQESPLPTWTDSNGGLVKGRYNIVYSVGDPATNPAPCDVTQWQNLYPIAHAPYDSHMHGTYGLADYPFRDSEGNLIAEQYDIEGTYPWVDRMGRNIFFGNVYSMLFNVNPNLGLGHNDVMVRYADGCVTQTCTDPTGDSNSNNIDSLEELSTTRGVTMAGRWTHGKMVQLDALINNIDYGLYVPDSDQRMVTLYSTGQTAVQMGSGRDNKTGVGPAGFSTNGTVLDSFENLYMDFPALQPTTLREVVWQMNMGKGGDEVAFDDYIDPEAFIVSEMTASTTFNTSGYPLPGPNTSFGVYPAPATYNEGFSPSNGFSGPIHLQNAATSVSDALQQATLAQPQTTPPPVVAVASRWNVPAYGLVNGSETNAGSARVEPAALGGIKGKGFWLQQGNYVSYTIPQQPTGRVVSQTPWFISLFVDMRIGSQNDNVARQILSFPDTTQVSIVGGNQIKVTYNGQQVTGSPVSLASSLYPPNPGWWHVAFQVHTGGNTVDVYVNGYFLSTVSLTSSPIFQLTPGGTLQLGGTNFQGWVDEFKVLAHSLDYETICNHAHGTIVAGNSLAAPWPTIAASYPAQEKTDINTQIGQSYSNYVCYMNYSSDTSAARTLSLPIGNFPNPNNLPGGAQSVRAAIHFPQVMHWNSPRPEESGNIFCQSCHTDNGGQFSNSLLATQALPGLPGPLKAGSTSYGPYYGQMSQDPRRQPMHPQRLMFGTIPAGFIQQSPAIPPSAQPSGSFVDKVVFP